MLLSGCCTARLVTGAISAGALAAALLIGAAGSATADPDDTTPPPPNCTAADLAGVSGDVATATSGYLFAHPDVNDFFTNLRGQSRDDIRDQLQDYMNAHPQTHADLQGIRQPLTDLQNRCGIAPLLEPLSG